MTERPSLDLWQAGLGLLLEAESEQAALDAAVATVAALLGGPAAGVLKGRAEHFSSVATQGQDRFVAPLVAEALARADMRLLERPQRHRELFAGREVIAIPLHDDDQTLGAICALPLDSSYDPGMVAIIRQALVRAVQHIRRMAEARLLYEISLRLSSTLDLQQLLHEVLELTTATFAAASSRIFLADERTDQLVMAHSSAARPRAVETVYLPAEGTIAGWVMRQGLGVIRNDARDEGSAATEQETGIAHAKLICAPLKQDDRTLGALLLANQIDDADFPDEDLRLLTTIAGVIAVKIANARLYQRAIRDALTGAYNRGAFDTALQERWAQWSATGTGFTLMLLDLDNFKQINDCFGHSIGDAVLQAVIRLLWEALRGEDTIFRYGGEEFGVLLRGLTDPDAAAHVAERLRRTLDRELALDRDICVRISASIGVALHPLHGAHSTRGLLDLADEAAYEAKHRGKNQICIARV